MSRSTKKGKKEKKEKEPKQEQSTEELGPRCPGCGAARWSVYRSVKKEFGWIRKRVCKACDYSYHSIERGPEQS